jgi:chemotaxis protein CheD
MKVMVLGGAQILDQNGLFNIGKRNHTIVRKMFWKNNVMVDYEAVGGTVNRTIKFSVDSGEAWLKVSGESATQISWM